MFLLIILPHKVINRDLKQIDTNNHRSCYYENNLIRINDIDIRIMNLDEW